MKKSTRIPHWRHYWPEDVEAAVQRDFEAGVNLQEIGRKHGRKDETIRLHARRMGWKRPLHEAGAPLARLPAMEVLGSPEKLARFKELIAGRATLYACAKEMGVDHQRLARLAKRLGLDVYSPGKGGTPSFTPDEEAAVERMFEEGWTYAAIAADLEKTYRQVEHLIVTRGWQRPKRKYGD